MTLAVLLTYPLKQEGRQDHETEGEATGGDHPKLYWL
jgi:hypothetical protein